MAGLITSKAKRKGWKPNTIKQRNGDKSNWLGRKQAWEDDDTRERRGTAKLLKEMEAKDDLLGDAAATEGARPSWWATTRSNRPPPSMAKQKRQKFYQSKQLKLKSKAVKKARREIKKAGGGSRARGLKGAERGKNSKKKPKGGRGKNY